MTEKQLRKKVVTIAKGWIGRKESNGTHRKIIDIYNSHKPLAQGYKVKYNDHWCAATVSAAFIEAGLTSIAPTECSCSRMIALYKKLGRWEEKDSYTPQMGDIIMYDWQDSGKGDNTGSPDHVGLVVSVSGKTIKVIEGNINDAVGYRTMTVNGKNIRGYCLPDYASKAKTESKPRLDASMNYDLAYSRTYTVSASALNMRYGASTKKAIIKSLPKGSKVRCYGYYTRTGATKWLYVQDSKGDVGFCSKTYLR